MTIKKLTAGNGYTYLTREVAGGDVRWERGQSAADYYTAAGNPPGVWLGRGAPLLGLDGAVSEDQMRALFGLGQHPDADQIVSEYVEANVRADMTDSQLVALARDATRAASLGRPFPEYAPLGPYEERVTTRLARIATETGREPGAADIARVRREEARKPRAAVAGFDLVFAPVKSAALLWALDERDWVRRAVREAHEEARDAALALLEKHAAFTRVGVGGVAQIETRGLIAAAFEHHDSRAGEPNLHTHVAVSSKVQGIDGKWRSLDARPLYRMAVAASEYYSTIFETALTARTGVQFADRSGSAGQRRPVREIVGVPEEYVAYFSSRRAQIEARVAELVAEYRQQHGHDPSRATWHKLTRQANLETREAKRAARTLADKRADWAQALTAEFGPDAVPRLMAAVPAQPPQTALTSRADVDVEALARATVAALGEQRSTWTRWNVLAEVERIVRARHRFADAAEHHAVVDRVVAVALSPAQSVRVDAPALVDEPAALRRSDGASVYTEHAAERYTSGAVLDAEARLLEAARTIGARALPDGFVRAALDGFEATTGRRLDPGQRQLVTAFLTDPRHVVVGLGPAGSGKTTAMRALRHVTTAAGVRLVPLATSAASAAVLGQELGVPAENVHKFLHQWTAGSHADKLRSGQPVPDSERAFALHPGDVLLVDEAGMAGTLNLDRLVSVARSRGAVVRLLGDHRQLAAVECGGALRLLAHDVGAVELSTLYRFTDPDEAAATLRLRDGDVGALDYYAARCRVRGGARDAMTDLAYAGWRADMLAGRTTLLAAAATADVTALSARARSDRVAARQVEPDGVRLHDGNLAGRGDWITTRHNDRRLTTHGGRDFVKNGDAWLVHQRRRDGSLVVEHLGHHGRITLPASYVNRHVELLYATTTHRAQGTTVDTAHPLISDEMTRENLYVIATRARERTTFYVTTHEPYPLDPDDRLDATRIDPAANAAREVLTRILDRESTELSATEAICTAQTDAERLPALVGPYLHALDRANDTAYRSLVATVTPDHAAELLGDPAWPALTRALHRAETTGWQPARLLAHVLQRRDLTDAESLAEVLAWRIDSHLERHEPPPHRTMPSAEDVARYKAALAAVAPDLITSDTMRPPTNGGALHNDDFLERARASTYGAHLRLETVNEPAWPALDAALHRAELDGWDADLLLGQLAVVVPLDGVRQRSEVLAWHLNTYLRTHHPAADTAHYPADETTAAWRRLCTTLHAAEESGLDPESLLRQAAAQTADDPGAQHLHHLAQQLEAAHPPRHAPELPPWLPTLHPTTAADDPKMSAYLRSRADLITHRLRTLALDTAAQRPAWTTHLGPMPTDPGQAADWLHHLGVLAAYREQYCVGDDHPDRPLGPYIERGHAGHTAYRHAAAAVAALEQHAGLAAESCPRAPSRAAHADLVRDVHMALPPSLRETVSTAVGTRLGHAQSGPPAATAAHLSAHFSYQDHVATELARLGILTDTVPDSPGTGRDADTLTEAARTAVIWRHATSSAHRALQQQANQVRPAAGGRSQAPQRRTAVRRSAPQAPQDRGLWPQPLNPSQGGPKPRM